MRTRYGTALSTRPRLFGTLALACGIAIGCGNDLSEAHARPYIPPLAITISPASVTLAPGASAVFTAQASGGEAIRLFVDWKIQEGTACGSIAVADGDTNGNSSATYTAPANRAGPCHLIASIRSFPAVKAIATIN